MNTQPYVPRTLGERIAHYRRVLGVFEGQDILPPNIAERVGVSAASVYNWEADESVPGRENLEKLAEELGVTPAYLHYGPDKESVRVVRVNKRPPPKRAAGDGDS